MQSDGYRIGIVGATGVVGRELAQVLIERGFPVSSLRAFASERSRGAELEYGAKSVAVEPLTPTALRDFDIVFVAAGTPVSKEYAPIAAENGAIVIDKSNAFRMDPAVPLIVPEVNADVLRERLKGGTAGLIVASPNCATIPLTVVLRPLLERAEVRRVVVSTYQSVSGAGQKGIDELSEQVRSIFNYREIAPGHFPHQIAFNCIPQIDLFEENGYTKEEMKTIRETRKILRRDDLAITATSVRVPVFSCHAESVNIEFERELSPDDVRALLRESPGVIVIDDPASNEYPVNTYVVGTDATFVGRIRRDESVEHGVNLWIVADNLRKGAALNAVQIAEVAVNEKSGAVH